MKFFQDYLVSMEKVSPAALAYTAMVHARLGHESEAEADCEHFRKFLKRNAEAGGKYRLLLEETEETVAKHAMQSE